MLRLRLLGGLSVDLAGAPVGGSAAQPRRLAILAVIARAGARGITREQLQALLWPDLNEERGRRVLTHALYALRRDLGGEGVITGVKELRLDPGLIACDLLEFEAACAERDLERAAAAYGGPFLQGFRLPGSPEFERWADDERTALAHRNQEVLEKLGREATRQGDTHGAVQWWRRAVGQDPLNARFTAELMHALVAADNPAGALQQSRIYEALLQEELGMPPDREIIRLAQQIRDNAARATLTPEPSADAEPTAPPTGEAQPSSIPETPPRRRASDRRRWASLPGRRPALVALVVVIVLSAVIAVVRVGRPPVAANARAEPVLVVGAIPDHRHTEGPDGLGTVADLLATSLARVEGLRVVSTARVYELLAQMGADVQQPTPAEVAAAARLAGASELIDGAVYPLTDGNLRLDFRRTRLSGGELVDSHTMVGPDLFTLVDSGTLRLARNAGARTISGSIADVTTSSELAYGFYQEGLRHYFRSDFPLAHTLFRAALREDSTFAMAAFYAGLTIDQTDHRGHRALLERARALADRASDRERLSIAAGVALLARDPSLLATAETLAVRYPLEVEGHLYTGMGRSLAGQSQAAVEPLQRVVRMDSLAFPVRLRCAVCDALETLVHVYTDMDSASAALREAIRWTLLQPGSPRPWFAVMASRLILGQNDSAAMALRRAIEIDPDLETAPAPTAYFWMYQDRADRAEAELRRFADVGGPAHRIDRSWYLAIALREQGRFEDALGAARAARVLRRAPPDTLVIDAMFLEAQIHLDAGRARAASAVFDSLTRRPAEISIPFTAMGSAWARTHQAAALFAAGDTARLAAWVDTIARHGSHALSRQLLHHYARGLLYDARGDAGAAVLELRRALPSRLARVDHHLSRILMRLGRPEEAISILQPALRRGFEGPGLYVTRTELHELLAQAWDAAGQPDSAIAHYRLVAQAWKNADSPWRARGAAAAERVEGH